MKPSSSSLPLISEFIHTIRGHKVILDSDLARLYGVTTKALNQAVKRNSDRFSHFFAFHLTHQEKTELVTNCDRFKNLKHSTVSPWAFTEHGALMVANVLNSPKAIKMSVALVETFVQMRHLLLSHETFTKRLAEIDKTLLDHDQALGDLYQKLLPLLAPPPLPPKRRMGFH